MLKARTLTPALAALVVAVVVAAVVARLQSARVPNAFFEEEGRFAIPPASRRGIPDVDNPNQPRLPLRGGISAGEFRAINARLQQEFYPTFKQFGVILAVEGFWKDDTENAFAEKIGHVWSVKVYGGMARLPEMTTDAYALVVCHEIGHHLGGYPFKYAQGHEYAAEGEADYFATHYCLRRLWDRPAERATNAQRAQKANPSTRFACDLNWPALQANDQGRRSRYDRDICYRVGVAAQDLAVLFSHLNGFDADSDPSTRAREREPAFETYTYHPEAQCRLDTYLAGALCTRPFDPRLIPGRRFVSAPGPDGEVSIPPADLAAAEREALAHSCAQQTRIDPVAGVRYGGRPLCWFKPLE